MQWIKAHTSEAQRRTLGLTEADVMGNGRADVAAKAALPPPSPHMLQWQRWRDHARKFRLFWGAFGPTLARRARQEQHPQLPREVGPPEFGPAAPVEIGDHARVVVGTDPPLIQCLQCGIRVAHANLRNRGCRNPRRPEEHPVMQESEAAGSAGELAGGVTPVLFQQGEVEPPMAGVG